MVYEQRLVLSDHLKALSGSISDGNLKEFKTSHKLLAPAQQPQTAGYRGQPWADVRGRVSIREDVGWLRGTTDSLRTPLIGKRFFQRWEAFL